MNRVIVTLIIFMVIMSAYVPAYAQRNGNSSLNITLEDLANMPSADREQVIAAYNTLQDSKNGTASIGIQAKEAVVGSLEAVKGVDFENLTTKAEKIAEAIVAFCAKLGVGVEKVLSSKTGMIIMVIIAFKIGMFGTVMGIISSIIGIIACTIGILLFTYILFAVNTNKKVKFTETVKDGSGKIVSVNTREELVPRFNALFMKLSDGTDVTKTLKYYSNVSTYRGWVSAISAVLVILFIISM